MHKFQVREPGQLHRGALLVLAVQSFQVLLVDEEGDHLVPACIKTEHHSKRITLCNERGTYLRGRRSRMITGKTILTYGQGANPKKHMTSS